MVDLTQHPVLQRLYDLANNIEALGTTPQLDTLSAEAQNIMTEVDKLVRENKTLRLEVLDKGGKLPRAA